MGGRGEVQKVTLKLDILCGAREACSMMVGSAEGAVPVSGRGKGKLHASEVERPVALVADDAGAAGRWDVTLAGVTGGCF